MRAVYGMVVCGLMALFNGWRSFDPIAWGDFVASYISVSHRGNKLIRSNPLTCVVQVIVFIILSMAYHVKLDKTWNPRGWRVRANEDLSNPKSVSASDPRRRRGKLHRQNQDHFLSKENLVGFLEWVWVWMK